MCPVSWDMLVRSRWGFIDNSGFPAYVTGVATTGGSVAVTISVGTTVMVGAIAWLVAVAVALTGSSVDVGGRDVAVAASGGTVVMVGLAVGEGDGSEAVPIMRRKTALAKPPRLPTPSIEYVPAGPTGTLNVPEAVPVDDATIPLATVLELCGAVRN